MPRLPLSPPLLPACCSLAGWAGPAACVPADSCCHAHSCRELDCPSQRPPPPSCVLPTHRCSSTGRWRGRSASSACGSHPAPAPRRAQGPADAAAGRRASMQPAGLQSVAPGCPQHVSPLLPVPAHKQLLEVSIDASDVPSDYILAILSQCSTFPEQLIFFLKGKLVVRWPWAGGRGAGDAHCSCSHAGHTLAPEPAHGSKQSTACAPPLPCRRDTCGCGNTCPQ